jgi:hypothetical protein
MSCVFSHSRLRLAGIHLRLERDLPTVKVDARQKHSGMTLRSCVTTALRITAAT